MTFRGINRFFLLTTAPFLGILLVLFYLKFPIHIPQLPAQAKSTISMDQQVQQISGGLDVAKGKTQTISALISQYFSLYHKTAEQTQQIEALAASQVDRPQQIFNARVARVLGNPINNVDSANIGLNLYSFTDPNFKGYGLKVDMKTTKAMQMALGQDKLGGSETTLSAVERYGAIAGVNAGGFADDPKTGLRYPLSTTVLNGKYVYGFEPTFSDLTFVGISTDDKLIGGKFTSQSQLDALHPRFGVTFVPQLLKDGTPLTIPDKWLTSPRRAPRTVIGNFNNGQLIFLVVDGYNEDGSSGATLPEMQNILEQLHIKDAYNLDGGGSSSLIFEGKVINHPSDGQLRKLATNFLFFK